MKNYEITFEWKNGDWTWTYVEARDFHEAIARALIECPRDCRIHNIRFLTREQLAANQVSAAKRTGGSNV
jgi:hypothetical protein